MAADRCDGVDVPRGALVIISPWVLHRHRRRWEAPDAFVPSRFLGDRQAQRYAYMPFGAGPRVCVGAQFGLAEAVLVLAILVKTFELRLADPRPVVPAAVVSMQPERSVRFRLRPGAREHARRDCMIARQAGLDSGKDRNEAAHADRDRRAVVATGRFLRGLYRLGHPLPTFATAAAVVLFVATARNGRAPLVDLIVAFLVFYLLLYSIGAMNDYCDEAVDRTSGRPEKPLAAGDVSRRTALVAWIGAAALSVVAAFYFNFAAAAMILPLWLAGVAYNFWAKATVVSWLPFVFFYPSLPYGPSSPRDASARRCCWPIRC